MMNGYDIDVDRMELEKEFHFLPHGILDYFEDDLRDNKSLRRAILDTDYYVVFDDSGDLPMVCRTYNSLKNKLTKSERELESLTIYRNRNPVKFKHYHKRIMAINGDEIVTEIGPKESSTLWL